MPFIASFALQHCGDVLTAESAENAEIGVEGRALGGFVKGNVKLTSAISANSAVTTRSEFMKRIAGGSFTAGFTEVAEMNLNVITQQIIGAAIEVHRALGPGLLESVYEACLVHELVQRKLDVERQTALPVGYKGIKVDCGYRIDLLVEGVVIVELKAVNRIEPIHEAQLLSYLKLSGCHVGLLINFNVKQLTRGLRRFVNELPEWPQRSLR